MQPAGRDAASLVSIGLGGGSHVSLEPLKIGPLSVGYRLLSDGIAFGGTQLRATDVAIAAGIGGGRWLARSRRRPRCVAHALEGVA